MEEKEKTLYEELFGDNKETDIVEVNDNKDITEAINSDLELDNIINFDKEETKKEDVTLEDANLFKIIDDTLYDLKLNLEDNDILNTLSNDNEEAENANDIADAEYVKKDAAFTSNITEEKLEKQDKESINADVKNSIEEIKKEDKYKDIANYKVNKENKKSTNFLYYFGYVCIFILVLATFSFSILFVAK